MSQFKINHPQYNNKTNVSLVKLPAILPLPTVHLILCSCPIREFANAVKAVRQSLLTYLLLSVAGNSYVQGRPVIAHETERRRRRKGLRARESHQSGKEEGGRKKKGVPPLFFLFLTPKKRWKVQEEGRSSRMRTRWERRRRKKEEERPRKGWEGEKGRKEGSFCLPYKCTLQRGFSSCKKHHASWLFFPVTSICLR